MKAAQECIREITRRIGEENISLDKATRVAHRITHGPECMLHMNLQDFTCDAVVRPRTTEDIVHIVNQANKYEIPLIPQGGRSCTYGAESIRNGIVIDTTSMNKILEFDGENFRITAQSGVRISSFMDYLAERNYMSLEYPSLNQVSTLGSRAAVSGNNIFENRWQGSRNNIRALEVVLANGDVVQVGQGSRLPVKSIVGFDMMSMFMGSRGTLGIITKITEKFISPPPAYFYGIKAFHSLEDAIGAYTEFRSPRYSGLIWRAKTYHKWLLSQAIKMNSGQQLPDDVVMLVDYHILGEPDVVEAMKKYADEIWKKHNGFWRDDMPSTDFIARHHGVMKKYMGMAAIQSERLINGGMGNRIVPLDPSICNTHLVDFVEGVVELLKRLEDGKSYPALSKHMHALNPGQMVPTEEGWSRTFTLLLADWKRFDQQTIQEFKKWYRDFAELVFRLGGTLSGTHGFIPKDMEVEYIKRELGEKEYELMKTIKHALDPKNIMNPHVKF